MAISLNKDPQGVAKEKTLEQYWDFHRLEVPNKESLDAHVKSLKLELREDCVDPKAVVGIEVEVENLLRVDPNVLLMFWGMKEDGSLRNSGREFITRPIPAYYAFPALSLLFNGLNTNLSFTKRTSIHVHINVRNLYIKQLLAFACLYHCVEPLFFTYVGGNRSNNIFCVPWTSSEHFESKFSFAKVSWEALWRDVSKVEKYSALNFQPIKTMGTVEFRHMPGNNDVAKIYQWINLILSLRTYALKNDFDSIIAEITNLNTNSQYDKFLTNVFGKLRPLLADSNLLMTVMERNIADIKSSMISAKFHGEALGYSMEEFQNSKLYKFFWPNGQDKGKQKTKKEKDIVWQQVMVAETQVDPERLRQRQAEEAQANVEILREPRVPRWGAAMGGNVAPAPERNQQDPGDLAREILQERFAARARRQAAPRPMPPIGRPDQLPGFLFAGEVIPANQLQQGRLPEVQQGEAAPAVAREQNWEDWPEQDGEPQ